MENNNIDIKKIISETIEKSINKSIEGLNQSFNFTFLGEISGELNNVIVVDSCIYEILTSVIRDACYKFFNVKRFNLEEYIIEETLKEINNLKDYKIKVKLRKTVQDYVEAAIKEGWEEGVSMDEDTCKPLRLWPYQVDHVMKKLDLLIEDKLEEVIEVPFTNEALPE